MSGNSTLRDSSSQRVDSGRNKEIANRLLEQTQGSRSQGSNRPINAGSQPIGISGNRLSNISSSGSSHIQSGSASSSAGNTSVHHSNITDNIKSILHDTFISKQDILSSQIEEKQRYYDVHGIVVCRDDLKEIKGKYIDIRYNIFL
jgi:hypothetical protein